MGCGVRPADGRHQLEGSASHPDHRPNVAKCLWLALYERVEALLAGAGCCLHSLPLHIVPTSANGPP